MRKILLIILSLIIFSCSSNNEPKNGIVLTYHNSWPIFLNEYFKAPIKEKITYKDGLRHGEYISYFDDIYGDGDIKEKGSYKNDLKDGEFIFWQLVDEYRILEKKVTYKNGVRDGEYISYFDRCGYCNWSNVIKEKGSYKNDLKDGEFILWQRGWGIDPVLEEKVTYKDGLRHGMTIIYTDRGSKQEEITFKNDLRDGKYRKYSGDCLEEESFYSNGKKNGKSFVYPSPCYKDYVKYITDIGYDPRTGFRYTKNKVGSGHNYKNNIPENTYGLIQVYTFKDGVEDGEFLSYYEKGVLETTGSYKDGKVHGFFVSYHTGSLLVALKSSIFDKDASYGRDWVSTNTCYNLISWSKTYGLYFRNSNCKAGERNEIYSMIKEKIIKNPLIASESNWANGLQNGPYTDYHYTTSNEQIIDGKGNTINGMPFGPYQSYYDTGQLRYDGVFNEDGHLVYGKSFYKNGELKEEFLEEDLEERIAAKQRKNSSSSSSSSSYRCPSGTKYFSRNEAYSWYSSQYPSFGIVVTDWGNSWNVSVNSNSGIYKSIPVPKCQ